MNDRIIPDESMGDAMITPPSTKSAFVETVLAATQGIIEDAMEKDVPDIDGSDSNLVKYAIRELKLIHEEPAVIEGYIKVIQAFADMGHSGGSASIAIPVINKLLSFKNISPLTDDPDEWEHHTSEVWGEPGGIWQSTRDGEAFSTDGGWTYTLLSDGKDGPVYNTVRTGKNPMSAVTELCEAIRLTVEYVGIDMLPPIPGWSWYDALCKYAPETAKKLSAYPPTQEVPKS